MRWSFDYNRAPEAIILACQEPGYQLYDLGDCGDVYRNRDLLELFEGVETIGISRVARRFVEMKRQHEFSEAFEARRAGEVLQWAIDRGIAERIVEAGQPAWRIVDREMQYLAVGPAAKQRAIRIRGLKDPDAAKKAAKLEKRELRRRQRARLKEIAGHRAAIDCNLYIIMHMSPEEPLPAELERFRVEGYDLLRNYHSVLIDSAVEKDGWKIVDVLADIEVKASMARRAAATAPVLPDDDADAMGDISF